MLNSITTRKQSFRQSITKEEINALPLVQYDGPTKLVRTDDELRAAVASISRSKVLGFDTETRPSFKKTDIFLPSLLQLCDESTAYLIQFHNITDYQPIVNLFENPKLVKAGVAIKDDLIGLMKIFPFAQDGFIDLADLARCSEIKNTGLRSLTAILMGKRISKGAQVSNWAKEDLTQKQVVYAATDAWISRELYLIFKKTGVLKKLQKSEDLRPKISTHLKRKITRKGLDSLRYHILFSSEEHGNKNSLNEKGEESFKYLRKRLEELEIDGVYLNEVDSLGISQKGPIVIVYPDGIWYHSCTPDVIERILSSHIIKGKPLNDYVLIPLK